MIIIPSPSVSPGFIPVDTSDATIAKGWIIAMVALAIVAILGSRGIGGRHEK